MYTVFIDTFRLILTDTADSAARQIKRMIEINQEDPFGFLNSVVLHLPDGSRLSGKYLDSWVYAVTDPQGIKTNEHAE